MYINRRFLIIGYLLILPFVINNIAFARRHYSNCEEPIFLKLDSFDRIYTFKVSSKCHVEGDHFSAEKVAHAIQDSLNEDNGFEIIDSEPYTLDNLIGEKYKLKEVRQTEHGRMNLDLDASILRNEDTVKYFSKSSKINSSGKAKYTISEESDISIHKFNQLPLELDINILVRIKKPKFAPTKLFLKEVKKGMTQDMKKNALNFYELVKKTESH